jgi:hypothetical protein
MAFEDTGAPGIRGRFRVTPQASALLQKHLERAAQEVGGVVINRPGKGVRKLVPEVTCEKPDNSPQAP